MPRAAVLLLASLSVALAPLAPGTPADDPPVTALLDRYASGDFDTVVAVLDARASLQDTLDDLKAQAPRWIEAGGQADVDRRQLAATTFALEAARTGVWKEWKFKVKVPPGTGRDEDRLVYWRPPPQLLEWACELLRTRPTRHAWERTWQLAALSVAQRAEDYEFLVGDGDQSPVVNTGVEIHHLLHVMARFPDEPRFKLAQAIAEEWRTLPGADRLGGRHLPARTQFEQLQKDQDIGAEATLRLGRLAMGPRSDYRPALPGMPAPTLAARGNDDDRARDLFTRVETMTRDPWLLYLARFFRGQVLERQRKPDDAERAYRSAVAAVPNAQAASTALAAALFANGRRAEASSVIDRMLAAAPPVVDPYRGYLHADDRFWPVLIARLRGGIHP